jgi:tripartite ATP-independent transporter DctP family solute receptor
MAASPYGLTHYWHKKSNLLLLEEFMRSRLLPAVALLSLFVFVGSGTAAAAEKVYEAVCAHHTSELDPLHLGYVFFGEEMKKRSNGRITYRIYPNAQLSSGDVENLGLIKTNSTQFASVPQFSMEPNGASLKPFNLFDIPFLFDTPADLNKLVDGKIGDQLTALLDEVDVKSGPGWAMGWQKITTTKGKIASPADIKGQKIRCGPSKLLIEFLKAAGAGPVVIAYGETFTALQQGVCDGMCTATSLYISDRLYEVQKYMGCVDFAPVYHVPVVSKIWYEKLPKDLQQVVDESMVEWIAYARKISDEAEESAKRELATKYGMTVTELTPEQKAEWAAIGAAMWDVAAPLVGPEFLVNVRKELGK